MDLLAPYPNYTIPEMLRPTYECDKKEYILETEDDPPETEDQSNK